MTDDPILLASVYLDGHATEDERAQVEADAELLIEVERLRRVRVVLSDPGSEDTAPLSTRERHLAAALDIWDQIPAGEQLGNTTPPGIDRAKTASITTAAGLRDQRSRRRPLNTRILTAAAAVVVLAGAGLVVNGSINSSNSDESTDSTNGDLVAAADEPTLDVLAAEEFATEGEGEVAEEVAEAAAPAAAVEPEEAAGGGPEQAPPERDLEVLSSNAELAVFANDLVLSRSAQTTRANPTDETSSDDTAEVTAPPTLAPPVDLCGLIDDFVGFAYWEGSGQVDEPVAVGIDNSSNQAVAYQAETCTQVTSTPLP